MRLSLPNAGSVWRRIACLALFASLSSLLPACGAHRIHQVYYLGVFDPSEQLPPSVYRLRVKGTADGASLVKYAAGWVPASFVDSLGTSIGFDPESNELTFKRTDGEDTASGSIFEGRRLMLFGPEGFREAPADHRLAIVMAGDPSKFFEAIDTALGQLSAAEALKATSSPVIDARITKAMLENVQARAQAEKFDAKLPEDAQ